MWGSGDALAPSQFLLQNIERSQPPPASNSVSRHHAPFPPVLLEPNTVTQTGLHLSSSGSQVCTCGVSISTASYLFGDLDTLPDRCSQSRRGSVHGPVSEAAQVPPAGKRLACTPVHYSQCERMGGVQDPCCAAQSWSIPRAAPERHASCMYEPAPDLANKDKASARSHKGSDPH